MKKHAFTRAAFGLLALSSGLSSNPAAQSLRAKIELDHLLCIDTTGEPFSDEVVAAGAWAKESASGALTSQGYLTLPPPDIDASSGKVYDEYSVEAGEWAFTSDKALWFDDLGEGESITLLLNFIELDGEYTSREFAMKMASSLAALVASEGTDPFAYAEAVIASLRYFFTDGPDLLGGFVLTLKNERGVLVKELVPAKHSRIAGATRRYDHTLARWSPFGVSIYPWYVTLFLQGYKIGRTVGSLVLMHRETYFGELSDSKQEVRVVLDGDGPQKYLTSVRTSLEVRRGFWTGYSPQTWALETTTSTIFGVPFRVVDRAF